MCGLFGLIDNKNQLTHDKKKELVKHLAFYSLERGEDATGYALLKDNDLVIKKRAIKAPLFGPGRIRSNLVLGHTRFATCGDPKLDKNAHPFVSRDGRYAFSHNGVASEDYLNLKQANLLPPLDTEVDSEGMLRYLETVGFNSPGLEDFFSTWRNSSFAIAILDKSNQSLIFFHNNTNKIYGIFIDQVFIYASTFKILKKALTHQNLTHSDEQIFCLTPFTRHEILSESGLVSENLIISEEIKEIFKGQESDYE